MAIFTLDDGTEGMERESLDNGITAMLDALNHARGTLRDVIIPTGQVFTWSCLSISSFFICFYFLTTCLFQSLVAHSREKSWFLREHKEEWDHLIDEARLHRDMTAQLRQRVAKLTPLTAEADDLRWWEAESRQHTEDAVGMLQDLAVRARLDAEEAARVQKQQDELLHRDAKARECIVDLLEEVGKEKELKL